ncbi:RNA-binding protein 7-like [Octopus sinensis]|uniref:RNA-binding protein 7-like n=1 Tax=Octopus sinensis TaxID=2607531 RepID=A0A6P7SE85_9MOLL|nr:RNA-binding protein 7-like [Octopus sinensis]
MDAQERTLYVGNLPEKITEELLYELFLQSGPLEKVFIPKERSYAFVQFKHSESIPYTLQIYDGVSLHGKVLALRARQPRMNNQPEEYQPRETSQGSSPYGNHGNRSTGGYFHQHSNYDNNRYLNQNAGYTHKQNLPNMMPDNSRYEQRHHRYDHMSKDSGRNPRGSGYRNNSGYRHEPYKRY